MGVGLANLWFNNLVFTKNSELIDLQPEDASLNYFESNREEHTSNIIGYIGYNGLTQYKNMLLNYGFSVANIHYLPIENSGYSGSALLHPEEGYSRNASNEKIREYIYIDGQHYPVIQDDIISATIDNYVSDSAYITRITLGLLEDLNFDVNYSSPYLVDYGFNLIFEIYFPTSGTSTSAKISYATITVYDPFSNEFLYETTTDEYGNYSLVYSTSNPYVIISSIDGINRATDKVFIGELKTIRLRTDHEDVAVTAVTTLITTLVENERKSSNNAITDSNINDIYDKAKLQVATLLDIPIDVLFDDYLDTKNSKLAAAASKINSITSMISGGLSSNLGVNKEGINAAMLALANTVSTNTIDLTNADDINKISINLSLIHI